MLSKAHARPSVPDGNVRLVSLRTNENMGVFKDLKTHFEQLLEKPMMTGVRLSVSEELAKMRLEDQDYCIASEHTLPPVTPPRKTRRLEPSAPSKTDRSVHCVD